MRKPFRFWMTSGLAILAAAATGGRAFAAEERAAVRLSPFDVAEIVHRIDASAQRHGMHVMACMRQAAERPDESSFVLVLESSQGGTPVQMETADARPELLLSVLIKSQRQGGTALYLRDDVLQDLPEGLSTQVLGNLADLPAMLDEALAG